MGAPTGLHRLLATEARHVEGVAAAREEAEALVEAARQEVAEREARLDVAAEERERLLVERVATERVAREAAIDAEAAEAEAFYDDVPDEQVHELARWVLERLLAEEAA